MLGLNRRKKGMEAAGLFSPFKIRPNSGGYSKFISWNLFFSSEEYIFYERGFALFPSPEAG